MIRLIGITMQPYRKCNFTLSHLGNHNFIINKILIAGHFITEPRPLCKIALQLICLSESKINQNYMKITTAPCKMQLRMMAIQGQVVN